MLPRHARSRHLEELDDAALVLAALDGDAEATGAIFDRYATRIHDYCYRILRDPHTAADATQEAFIAANRSLSQLRDPSRLRPWLYTIARNACTREGKSRSKATLLEDVELAMDETDSSPNEPLAAALANEASDLVWTAAEGLAPQDQLVLDLQVRHGLEGAELAEAADVAPGQISMVTRRVSERLQRSIAALLMVRGGREECPELQELLADWDGIYSVLTRKRVARHIDRCEVCERVSASLVAPLGTAALVPVGGFIALPDPERSRVRTNVLAAHATSLERSEERPRRRRRLAAAACLLVAVAVGALALDSPSSSVDDAQASKGSAAEPNTPNSAELLGTTTTVDQAQAPDPTPPPEPPASAPWPQPLDGVEPGSDGGDATGTAAGKPDVDSAPPSDTAPASPAPAPANAAPTIASISIDDAAPMQTDCSATNATRTITALVSDDRGVASVVLSWQHSSGSSGSTTMGSSGPDLWNATLGPVGAVGDLQYRVEATDADGASATSSPRSIAVDPCPG